MRYTETQIIELLRRPKHKDKIDKAKEFEKELRLYTEAQNLDELTGDTAWENLCKLIAKRLPTKAFGRVMDFVEFPLASVELTGSLLVELYKVFQAKDVFFSQHIDTEEKNKKLKDVISSMDVHQYVIETGKECLKNKPNTIVVIDKDDKGLPYIVTVESERFIDGDIQKDGTFKTFISFFHSEVEGFPKRKNIAFYDTENYTVMQFDGETDKYTLLYSVPHYVGYCPARCFITKPLNKKNVYKRLSPIGNNLGKIRSWQLMDTYKYYAEHYAGFPVIEKMKSKCADVNCNNGMIPNPRGAVMVVDGVRVPNDPIKCQVCNQKSEVGVGTVINIHPKRGKDEDNGAGTFRFIAPEITGVEYLSTEQEKKEVYIALRTVGQTNLITKEAVNDKQVQGSFQSKESVLNNLKQMFEEIYIWIVETSARAYFLGDVSITVYANFGSEFYLLTEAEIQSMFEYAKKIGLPEAEVDAIYKRLIITKYKDNPDAIARMELLKLIDPAPYATFSEVDTMQLKGVLTDTEYIIKRRFIKFIDRFEMEQAPLVMFGNKLTLSEKIKNINNVLKTYANEYTVNNPEQPEASGKGVA